MNNDVKQLEELYLLVEKKAKPDFLDVNKNGDKKEPLKQALKDKESSECSCKGSCKCKKNVKENSRYRTLFNRILNEGHKTVCGVKINPNAQYNCVLDDGTPKVLKGESVIKLQHKCKSVKPAH